jgi:hypothetical protein
MVEIKGHLFKRLSKHGYPTAWYDEHGTFNGCEAMTKKQEQELEKIFKGWILENKTNEQKLIQK